MDIVTCRLDFHEGNSGKNIKKSNELHVSLEEIEVDFDERHRNSVSLAVQVEGVFFGFRISSQNSDYCQVYQEIYNGPDTAYTKVDLWRCWEKVMFWAKV